MSSAAGGIVVFGGGTATNSLVDVFESLRASRPGCTLSYVIPISDNGGSSSELIRVFGGPGIGDVRSRLVRLIPDSDTDPERASLKELFNHRLPEDHALARAEWLDIVESRHPLWGGSHSPSPLANRGGGISSEKRELIRSIFNIVNMEIVKRARPSSVFNFSRASIGNLFLTGGRVLTGSLESSVYLLSTICGVPEQVRVVPAINSSFTHHISAGLANGEVITGQNSISHPSAPTALPDDGSSRGMMADGIGRGGDGVDVRDETAMMDLIEDATLPGSLPTLRKPYITFNKGGSSGTKTPASTPAEVSRPVSTGQQTPTTTTEVIATSKTHHGDGLERIADSQWHTRTTSPPPPADHGETSQPSSNPDHSAGGEHPLPARIDRIWYINPYGHEIWPPANPKVVRTILDDASAVIYSIGSLYTSIVPSLVLRGVGAALANSRSVKHKILILNSSLDRETSGPPFRRENGRARGGVGEDEVDGEREEEFTAADFVRAIVRACVQSEGELPARMARRSSLSYNVRPAQHRRPHGHRHHHQPQKPSQQHLGKQQQHEQTDGAGTDPDADNDDFDDPLIVRRYVTHLVYLEGRGAPRVDKQVLAGLGVECIRVYGRREGGSGAGDSINTTTSAPTCTAATTSINTANPTGTTPTCTLSKTCRGSLGGSLENVPLIDAGQSAAAGGVMLVAGASTVTPTPPVVNQHRDQHQHQQQQQQQHQHQHEGQQKQGSSSGSIGGGALRYDIAGLARALEAVIVSRREMGPARSRRNTSGQ